MKALLLLLLLLVASGGGYWWWNNNQSHEPASPIAAVRFGEVTQAPISVIVNATGQIQPVTQVDVSTQVSGTLQEMLVDFNSKVKTGQVLARINTDNLAARVAQNKANLKRSEAATDRLRVELSNAQRQATRLKELREQGVVPQVDLENAEMNRDSLAVQVKVSEAEIEQARTTLQQSEIDVEHATITSPIDGVVIQRAVEAGQTVAASFNSPLLFQIANDLSQLQIRASVDEADIGRVQRCRSAYFSVDAFQGRVFPAKLEQVRLNPTITNNVVIYTCLFRVQNLEADGKLGPLLPGLTANLVILVDQRDSALSIPAAAMRFQPKGIPGLSAALSEAPSGGASSRPSREGHGKRSESMSGDEMMMPVPAKSAGGANSNGVVWVRNGDTLRAVNIKTGITDGSVIEVVDGDLKVGDFVAIGLAQADSGAPSGSFNPFGGNNQRPGGMGGSGMGGQRTGGGSRGAR